LLPAGERALEIAPHSDRRRRSSASKNRSAELIDKKIAPIGTSRGVTHNEQRIPQAAPENFPVSSAFRLCAH